MLNRENTDAYFNLFRNKIENGQKIDRKWIDNGQKMDRNQIKGQEDKKWIGNRQKID